ncbi:MAG: Chitodextrinase precursor, partial [Bacteroidota bacterium]
PVCPTSTVRDTMGNIYPTIAIANQCWMGANLRTSRFKNGDIIAFPLTAQSWSSTFTPAHGIYNNSATNDSVYGRLYNAYAAADSRGLCPTGWHVPTDAEWNSLATALGGSLTAGFALKSTSGWASLGNGNNSSGFSALPAGFRRETGAYDGILSHAYWWSSTTVPTNSANAYHRRVSFNAQNLYRDNSDKRLGYSIRCILD